MLATRSPQSVKHRVYKDGWTLGRFGNQGRVPVRLMSDFSVQTVRAD